MGIAPKVGWSGSGLPSDQLAGGKGKLVVRYKGSFDWTYLVRTVQRWFEQRRFRFYETRIKDTGKGLKADWEARRDIDEFWAEQYNIKVEAWHLSSQEIIVHGEPRKILNGMIQFTISDRTISDRNAFFKGKKGLLGFLGKLYMEMRWREAETRFVDVHAYRAMEIATVIQECLNMSTKKKAPW